MKTRSISLLIVLILMATCSFSQKLKKADKLVINNLKQHIAFLADDKLEGRRAGTPGEEAAALYISKWFEKSGIMPKGDNNGYLQSFDIYDGKDYDQMSYFFINGQEIKSSQYFPFPNVPETQIEAAPSIALKEAGVPWFVDLKHAMEENSNNPHFDINGTIETIVKEAAQKKATALLIYNTGAKADQLRYDGKSKASPFPIPVLYINSAVAKQYFADETATLDIKFKTAFTNRKRKGNNVVGYIDNGAKTTIVLGAHFDHLGYGEDQNSRYAGTDKQIHNGADDNASGTAALLELASLLKKSKLRQSNYLFIAFSGEELGLFGSKYYTEHATIDLTNVNYMVNMDMVGRLNDSTQSLTIGGVGTSPYWIPSLTANPNFKKFAVKFDSSGTGPSDHTSFYRKNIPVLFFFTGLHTDYHKPSDDAPLINYTGEYSIVQFIYKIIEATQAQPKLAFTKTRETQTTTSARFSVSMGIMPDYAFSGSGVRVDGVSDNRPAQKAGIKAGDIVTQLGDYPVSSVEQYMQALGKFKKGDKTTVIFKRGTEELKGNIEF